MEALYKCDIKNALLEASKNVKISISTLGENGSILYYDNKILEAEAYPVNVIDTTGAGDNFAAGFLYSYNNQVSFENCMKAGALCASETIKTIGARPQSNLKELLTKNSILKN
jgi:sugar/nucleoside kinase (ribokinase family)